MQEEISFYRSLRIQEVKDALAMQFDIKDIGNLHYFLGIKVLQDDKSKSIWIGQPLYINHLLKKFGMQDCKAVGTPVDVSTKLVKATNNDEIIDQQLYQSAIGSLLYLSVSTRPDITYAVSTLARFSSEPTKQHWTAVKRYAIFEGHSQLWYPLQQEGFTRMYLLL